MGIMFSLLSGMYVYLFGIPQYNVLVLGLDNSGKSTFLYQVGTICDRKKKKKKDIKKSPPPIPTLKQKISDDPNSPKISDCKNSDEKSTHNDSYFLYPDLRHILPTMGQNVKIMEFENMTLQFWDLPGQTNFRKIWTHYFKEVHGIVFMIDSADTERLNEARYELHKLFNEYDLKYAPILILANKQDLKQAVDYQSVIETLQIMTSSPRRSSENECKESDKLLPIDEHHQQQKDALFNNRSIRVMCTCCLNKNGLSDAISWLVYTIPLAKQRLEFVAKLKNKS